MTYFCVSDLHGYYDVLIDTLNKHGFDETNDNHTLIVIGDMVDRGPQNKELIEYIYKLHQSNKAIVLLGNHDFFLLEFLRGNFGRTNFNFKRNGHKITIEHLLGHSFEEKEEYTDEQDKLNEMYPYLKGFLESLDPYYELKDYVFVHGGVNSELPNWKEDTLRNFIWTRQYDHLPLPGKTLVVGHTPAFYVRTIDEGIDVDDEVKFSKEHPEYFEIHHKDNVIHIDGGVYYSGIINVLKLEI